MSYSVRTDFRVHRRHNEEEVPVSPETGFEQHAEAHYDADYFRWQRSIGQFSAKANRFKFAPYIASTARVVDFGCGGGYLLAAMPCAERMGIEVNPIARAEAERGGVQCVSATEELPDEWADVVISNSALEHVESPLTELRKLLPKVKRGGRIVFCVPHETLDWSYAPNDINQHLYTWSPMGLGNLFTTAGFVVESVTPSKLMWPPRYEAIYRVLGEPLFLAVCALYRRVRLILSPFYTVDSHASIIIVAGRPA